MICGESQVSGYIAAGTSQLRHSLFDVGGPSSVLQRNIIKRYNKEHELNSPILISNYMNQLQISKRAKFPPHEIASTQQRKKHSMITPRPEPSSSSRFCPT